MIARLHNTHSMGPIHFPPLLNAASALLYVQISQTSSVIRCMSRVMISDIVAASQHSHAKHHFQNIYSLPVDGILAASLELFVCANMFYQTYGVRVCVLMNISVIIGAKWY